MPFLTFETTSLALDLPGALLARALQVKNLLNNSMVQAIRSQFAVRWVWWVRWCDDAGAVLWLDIDNSLTFYIPLR